MDTAAGERMLAWGCGDVLPTSSTTLAALLAAAARDHAARDALVWRGRATTYAALHEAAARAARGLRARGAGAGAIVGVRLPRSPALVTALLAVLEAGAAYVPIDPALPAQRRALLPEDSGAEICVASERDLDGPAAAPAARAAAPGDLAYVIYTSGSTGRPKGVCVEHRSAVDFVVHNAAAYGVGSGTRMLALASPSFDVSVAEVFTALTTGATLVIAAAGDGASPYRLQRLLQEQRVTVAELPPALLGLLDPDALPDLMVGRSPLPPRSDWPALAGGDDRRAQRVRSLLALEAAGAEVLVLGADVTDPADMARVRAEAVRRFGAVHGVIHAAGVAGGTMVETHAPGVAEAVLAPKVAGTLALAAAFAGAELDFLVLCSSVTAVAGALGQVDYCAGNAFMDAFAHHLAASGVPAVSLDWGGWLEVGMAVETDAPAGFRDLQRGLRPLAVDHPLLDAIVQDEAGTLTATALLSPETHWVLDEHRILGTAVLPGTGYLELVRAAFDRDGDGRPVVLRDVVFQEPLGVGDGERRQVRVVIEGADRRFTVDSLKDGRWCTHARGAVGWGQAGPAGVHDVEAIRERAVRRRDDVGLQESASGLIAFGPRWSSLKRAVAGDGEELALLEAGPEVAAELSRYALHPAMLDEATAFGDFDDADGRYLPLGYGRLEVRRPLPPRFYSHVRYRRGGSADLLVCDLTLLDEAGTELVAIRDFMLRRIDPQAVDASLSTAPPADPAPAPLDGAEVGIRPQEGADALLRVLGARPAAQVVVSARDLPTLIAGVAEADRDHLAQELEGAVLGSGQAIDVLEGEYVEPVDDIQRGLVTLWEEVTGARGIGIAHDFFKVGGNSLVAVQLMSRVRAMFGVKLPIRSLFEAPTIAAMAESIAIGLEVAA